MIGTLSGQLDIKGRELSRSVGTQSNTSSQLDDEPPQYIVPLAATVSLAEKYQVITLTSQRS